MKKLNDETKTWLLYIIVIIFISIVVLRLFYLQVLNGTYYFEQSEYNSIRIETLQPVRGRILDRNGVVLAENLPSYDLEIVPEDVKDKKKEFTFLSSVIGIPEEKIEETIEQAKLPSYAHIIIKRNLTKEEVIRIKEHLIELPGISVSLTSYRYYPFKSIASEILGFVGPVTKEDIKKDSFYQPSSMIGKQGIEAEYEKLLRGKNGKTEVQVDASGRIRKILYKVPPEPGDDIYLTIDIRLQKELEKLVGNRKGVAIALDPNNGEILAMVSHPAFDPNLFVKGISQEELNKLYSEKAFINRAVQGQYPSGSTFKPITLFAALNKGAVTSKTVIYCRNSIVIGGRRFRDWIYPSSFGYQNPMQALANSSDVFFYTIGVETGVKEIVKYAKLFGLGEKTGIDLPVENTGLVPTPQWKKENVGQDWYPGDTANLSIGQGYLLVTPLQMAIMYEGIAEDGVEYKPHLLLKAVSPDGKVIKEFKRQIRLNVKLNKEHIKTVKDGLEEAVNKMYGGTIKAYGGSACAKTGTAEIGKNEVDHWLIAFAPRDKPKVVGLLFFDHSDFPSSHSLAPLMSDVFKKFFSIGGE